ncbi:MAG: oxidoreductase, partial [Dehalococcoidia bacterium]
HIHHSKTQAATSAQDFTGCTVESFRILAASDAWGHQKGYRPLRDMKSITFHEEHGEVSRNTVNPEMFK